MVSTRRLRLTLGYRGTRFAGWAVQSPSKTRSRPTLQGTVETALSHALGHTVRVTAAGRTDAGVHADAQVVSFDTISAMSVRGLREVLEAQARLSLRGGKSRLSAARRLSRRARKVKGQTNRLRRGLAIVIKKQNVSRVSCNLLFNC